MTEHPGEQFPPAVDPDVEPQPDERRTPDYDTEPEPESTSTPSADRAAEEGVHPLVEETMERLEGLRERPVSEHAEVYADLHERLQTALVGADAEHGDRG